MVDCEGSVRVGNTQRPRTAEVSMRVSGCIWLIDCHTWLVGLTNDDSYIVLIDVRV